MPSLFNQKISATYSGLLKTTSNGVLSPTLSQITDGNGNGSQLYLSTSKINFYNAYEFPTSDGSANQVLKTDGSGILTWEDDANTGGVTKTGTIALNTIAVWNDNVDELRSDTTMSINASHTISLLQTNSNDDNLNSYNIGGGNIANVTGSYNVGFGAQNLNAVLEGSYNTAMGDGSLEKVTSGNSNTGFGSNALGNSTSGDFNTAVGSGALDDVLTGENNTSVGYNAGARVSTGSGNTYIGKNAGLLDVGSNNIYIGEGSGSSVASGNNNVIIGSNTGNTISTTSNNIIISDGSGNNRLQFSNTGAATFSDRITATKMITTSFGGSQNGALSLRGAGGANEANIINFGYDGANFQPAYIGYLCTSGAANTNGALIFATRGVTTDSQPTVRLTISSGGLATFSNGIQFAASTGTPSPPYDSGATTLDAYEEGSWTPSIRDSSDVAANLDSNNSVGVYTRVGNLVYFRATIQITSYPSPAPSSSSVAFIRGFPYASATIPGNWYRPSSVITRYITFSGYLNLHVNANSNYGYLFDSVSASNGGAVEFSKYTSNSTLSISGVYEI